MRSLSLVVIMVLAGCSPAQNDVDPVCEQMRQCFFNDDGALLNRTDPDRYGNLVAGIPEIQAAYKAGGSCYETPETKQACADQCLCVMRELCNDASVRVSMCALAAESPEANGGLNQENLCCDFPALRAYEASEFETYDVTLDGERAAVDSLCQIPASQTVPPFEDPDFCGTQE